MEHDLPKLAPRSKLSHKGDFGRALCIGGSRGMAGAISIAAMAALRSGAGLVSVAVPSPILDTVAAMHPCLMTIPIACDSAGRLARSSREHLTQISTDATCVALGPGLGRSGDLDYLVFKLYKSIACTMVIDADALNALPQAIPLLPNAHGHRILTPHPGEFERLCGISKYDRLRQCQAAVTIARENRVVIVLKGFETLVTDGETTITNQTGNPKMASGGSGDCLTGIIAGLLCQGMKPISAAHLGVALHGAAGDLAAERLGCPSILATDILDELPNAFRQLGTDRS